MLYRNYYPSQMTAQFEFKCAETGRVIKKGEICVYYPIVDKVYCSESEQAGIYRSRQFDINMVGSDY